MLRETVRRFGKKFKKNKDRNKNGGPHCSVPATYRTDVQYRFSDAAVERADGKDLGGGRGRGWKKKKHKKGLDNNGKGNVCRVVGWAGGRWTGATGRQGRGENK